MSEDRVRAFWLGPRGRRLLSGSSHPFNGQHPGHRINKGASRRSQPGETRGTSCSPPGTGSQGPCLEEKLMNKAQPWQEDALHLPGPG
ncbi:hypothetical protein Y1Q_0016673 [Alligator mississippiensis]|uniref:Uncharacterized protein n=1 Tax=Alligator mississippiensis TaxID=8496 RepID=A0A151P1Y1_ALLMI|nr:hypothetical protein Y1Q_0016673 [Alligator mississippiensis]